MDLNQEFLNLSIKRKKEIEEPLKREKLLLKLNKQSKSYQDSDIRVVDESSIAYSDELPF